MLVRSPLCHQHQTLPKLTIRPKYHHRIASHGQPPNLQFPAIRFTPLPFPALSKPTDLYPGSEEVRSSILLGSTKFSDIFCIFLNGLRGRSPPHVGPVPVCEEVLGHHPVISCIAAIVAETGRVGQNPKLPNRPKSRLFQLASSKSAFGNSSRSVSRLAHPARFNLISSGRTVR